ncbi:MAG: putative secondary metabolism biosynthetic enzyme [Geoglossum umbratile]|nr:MAG: putative secondary metabolism biosynthetic enzyme [Geoglossum umbratile]
MDDFTDKVVVVTGCSSGIGLATTLHFLAARAKVFGIDITPFSHNLSAEHATAFTFHQCDLTAPNACTTAIADCREKLGSYVAILVNCAGIADGYASADTLTDDEWDRVIAVNLTVPVRMMREVLGGMKEKKKGAIVNVCSKASTSGASAGLAYTSSKHGLVRMPSRFRVTKQERDWERY